MSASPPRSPSAVTPPTTTAAALDQLAAVVAHTVVDVSASPDPSLDQGVGEGLLSSARHHHDEDEQRRQPDGTADAIADATEAAMDPDGDEEMQTLMPLSADKLSPRVAAAAAAAHSDRWTWAAAARFLLQATIGFSVLIIGILASLLLLTHYGVVSFPSHDVVTLPLVDTPLRPPQLTPQLTPELADTSSAAGTRRVAVCFFGQVKDLTQTLPSLKEHIFRPLQDANYSIDIFLHTYSQDQITNSRNGEANAAIDPSTAMQLRQIAPITVRMTAPETVDRLRSRDYYLQHGDPWPGTSNNTIIFFGRQLHSLDYLTSMWEAAEAQGREFQFVLYLRPDIRVYAPLRVADFASLTPMQVATPDFHEWGGRNDRMAIGPPSSMRLYGRRVRYIDEFFEQHPKSKLHAESFLKTFLIDHKVERTPLRIRFGRVRAHGHAETFDKCNEKACELP